VLAVAVMALRPGVSAAQRSAFAGDYVAAESASGALMAFGLSFGFAVAGGAVLGPHGGEDPGLVGAVSGFFAGAAVGSALGVHMAARLLKLPARFWEALGGGVAGTLLCLALPLDADEPSFWVSAYALPVVGAILASSAGSASRMRPTVAPAPGGLRLGLSVAF
jgi:hypothetical protein